VRRAALTLIKHNGCVEEGGVIADDGEASASQDGHNDEAEQDREIIDAGLHSRRALDGLEPDRYLPDSDVSMLHSFLPLLDLLM
jgi:hypothetical protein